MNVQANSMCLWIVIKMHQGASAPPVKKHQQLKNHMKKIVFLALRMVFFISLFLAETQIIVCNDYRYIKY